MDADENREPRGFDLESLSGDEIKFKLREMGIQTRLRSVKELKELLRNAINNGNM